MFGISDILLIPELILELVVWIRSLFLPRLRWVRRPVDSYEMDILRTMEQNEELKIEKNSRLLFSKWAISYSEFGFLKPEEVHQEASQYRRALLSLLLRAFIAKRKEAGVTKAFILTEVGKAYLRRCSDG